MTLTYLVPAECIKVYPKSLHVNRTVGRITYAIHAEQSTDFMYCICNRLDVMYRTQNVADMCASNKLDFVAQEWLQVLCCELESIFFARRPPLHSKPKTFGHEKPRLYVSLMLHL